MELFPELKLGITNGWLPLAVFYTMYGLLLLILPKSVRQRLYDRAGWTKNQRYAAQDL